MDGVIINSEPLHHKAYHLMFEKVGIDVDSTLYESFTGQATLHICKQLVAHFGLQQSPETLVSMKRSFFKDLFYNDPELDLIPGVRERIEEYHANGITMVLASSASMGNINNVFERFGLHPYFKAKLSGADLKASKPHPEIFLKAAEASGYEKTECMVIEDSTNGIAAAHRAGIYCVAFKSPNSKNQDYRLASTIINDFSEISLPNLRTMFANHHLE